MEDKIIAYTDGSAINNGSSDSKCGWAALLMYKGVTKEFHGNIRGYTNNQIEMFAVYKALQHITNKKIPVVLHSDSQYVIKTLNKEYQVGANASYWKQLFDEVEKFDDITFVWVKGHNGDRFNERVDQISFREAENA